ncbi:hypothetical protein [Paraflavitalea speifideaquila]|nr:hypothetical protein [Paraflavitalea speifideiaquila]
MAIAGDTLQIIDAVLYINGKKPSCRPRCSCIMML